MSDLFLPQNLLEEWALSERADVQGSALFITGDNTAYEVKEAVHIVKVESGSDEHKLLGKVKTLEQMTALGAEVLSHSAIAEESAYEVVPGYRVEVLPAQAPAATPAPPKPAPKAAAPAPPAGEDEDLLAKFLLKKM